MKLIDPSRFKKILKNLGEEEADDQAIAHEYFVMYNYNIFRLVIIAIMITYFIGCMVYFVSNEFNNEDDILNENTFITSHSIVDYESNKHRLAVCCYYALTMLSTVGYGDYYPISNLEMQMTVILMLAGVAFFSFIMGNFMDIIAEYDEKMGIPDLMPALNTWLVSLERYNGKPMKISLLDDISKNQQYFWNNDRRQSVKADAKFEQLPIQIIQIITSDYLFGDIFHKFPRFFSAKVLEDKNFLIKFASGLLPRKFFADDASDKIIYEEGQEVSELYFFVES